MNELIMIIVGIILLYYLDIKYIVIILLAFFILNDYKNIKKKVIDIVKPNKKEKIEYTDKISEILNKLKKYEKTSKNQYLRGLYYWKKFIKKIKKLENDKLLNFNQYFDRAFDYLKQSVNYFHSINVDVKERELLHGIKRGDYTNAKKTKEIASLAKELYNEGYLILYNLSLRLNERWKENPNINNKQIVLDHPLPFNSEDSSFDFFI